MLLMGEAYTFRLDHNGFQHLQLVIIVKGRISDSDVEKLVALHSKLVEIHIGEPAHHHSGASEFGEEIASAKSA